MEKLKIALTMGDPAGIGPEIAVRLAESLVDRPDFELLIYGSSDILEEARKYFAPGAVYTCVKCGDLPFSALKPGALSAEYGKLAYDCVKRAADDALAGRVDAIVTCPVNKAAVNLAGIPFTGHTELIARDVSHCETFAMMQSAGALRVVFATTHIPLREVPGSLTRKRVADVGRLLAEAIRSEGIADPLIGVAALNPHAGENGNLGHEESDIIQPAMDDLKHAGIRVEGPFPPDVLFIETIRTRFDGLISMYHDQGHIPFKMLAFDRGVNSTLGIPFIRTSVDHGTAFDIAWRGAADIGSLNAAFQLALLRARRVAERKKQGNTVHV